MVRKVRKVYQHLCEEMSLAVSEKSFRRATRWQEKERRVFPRFFCERNSLPFVAVHEEEEDRVLEQFYPLTSCSFGCLFPSERKRFLLHFYPPVQRSNPKKEKPTSSLTRSLFSSPLLLLLTYPYTCKSCSQSATQEEAEGEEESKTTDSQRVFRLSPDSFLTECDLNIHSTTSPLAQRITIVPYFIMDIIISTTWS